MMGNLWWDMYEECMVVCSEALLPLAITALFATGGPHNSEHAKWGKGAGIEFVFTSHDVCCFFI